MFEDSQPRGIEDGFTLVCSVYECVKGFTVLKRSVIAHEQLFSKPLNRARESLNLCFGRLFSIIVLLDFNISVQVKKYYRRDSRSNIVPLSAKRISTFHGYCTVHTLVHSLHTYVRR